MRVLIADDHPLILAGIKHALEEADGFEVVAEANTGAQVLPLVSQTNPDLCLLDMRMPEMDGLTCLDRIRQRHPDVKVVILSVSTDPDVIQDVLNRGASAYIVKSVNPVDLPSAIRQAFDETVYTAIGLPDSGGPTAAKAAGLTDREVAILAALARGLSNAAIAKELWVAPQTVKFHLTNIYRKLGVANRTEAARYAYQQGLVASPLYEGDDEARERRALRTRIQPEAQGGAWCELAVFGEDQHPLVESTVRDFVHVAHGFDLHDLRRIFVRLLRRGRRSPATQCAQQGQPRLNPCHGDDPEVSTAGSLPDRVTKRCTLCHGC